MIVVDVDAMRLFRRRLYEMTGNCNILFTVRDISSFLFCMTKIKLILNPHFNFLYRKLGRF